MIEMHELEQAWSGLDERLAEQNGRLEQLQQRRGLDAVRTRLRWISLGQIVQLVIGLLIVLWAGGYWFGHLDQPHLVVYGAAIHLYGIGLLGVAALQLVWLTRIEYYGPVLAVQRQLQALRRLRIRSERVLLLAGFVIWVPLVFIALNAIGVDVWLRNPATVLWNLGAGLAMGGLVAWLTYRFRSTFERDSAGRSLREAEAELDALEQPSQNN